MLYFCLFDILCNLVGILSPASAWFYQISIHFLYSVYFLADNADTLIFVTCHSRGTVGCVRCGRVRPGAVRCG